jgi:HEAT repeat protein
MLMLPFRLHLLRSKSAKVRQQNALALGKSRSPRALAGLLSARSDSSSAVRESVAIALGQVGGSAVTEPLVAMLSDRDGRVRFRAGQALRAIGWAPAEPPLQAAYALAMGDWRTLAELGDAAVDVISRFGGEHALETLGRIGTRRAIERIERQVPLRHLDGKEWISAFNQAHERVNDPELLRDSVLTGDYRMWEALGSQEPLELRLKALALVLASDEHDTRQIAVELPIELDDDEYAAPHDYSEKARRAQAARERADALLAPVLWRSHRFHFVADHFATLAETLETDARASEAFAEALQAAVAFLLTELPQDPGEVAVALAALGAQSSVEPLARWLCTPVGDLRGLRRPHDPNTPTYWRQPEWPAKREVATALGKLGWDPADPEHQGWRAAYVDDWRTLAGLGAAAGPAVIERLDELPFMELRDVLQILGPAASPYPDQLKKLLREPNPSPKLRDRAADVERLAPDIELRWLAHGRIYTGELGEEAVPWLLKGLRDPDPSVREAGLNGLVRMKSPLALEPLREALADSERQLSASLTLLNLGLPEAIDSVLEVFPSLCSYGKKKVAEQLVHFPRWREGQVGSQLPFTLLDYAADPQGPENLRHMAIGAIEQVKPATGAEAAAIADRLVALSSDPRVGRTAAEVLKDRVRPEHLLLLVQTIISLKGEKAEEHVTRVRELLEGTAREELPLDGLQAILALEDEYPYTRYSSHWGSPTGWESDETLITETEPACTYCTTIKQLAAGLLRGEQHESALAREPNNRV